MITDSRKLQLQKAKRRYEFKKMVSCKESKGIRYSITGNELADLFMNQTNEEVRVSGVVFLKGYRVVDTVKADTVDTIKAIDADTEKGNTVDTIKAIDADTEKGNTVDTVKAIDVDTVKATDLDTMQIPTAYQGIPLETTPQDLIELLTRFFHARHIAPDGIRRTLNRIAEYHNITLIPETTLDDLPDRIAEAVKVMTFNAEDVAKAILA